MPQPLLIGSKRQLADMLNLSERRVTDLVTAGAMPARGPRGFDLVAGVRGYVAFLKSKPHSLTDERARLTKAQAGMAELKLREKTGELVEKSAVTKQEFELGRRVRDSLENVPARVSGPCAAAKDQHAIYALIDTEIRQCLEGLADGV